MSIEITVTTTVSKCPDCPFFKMTMDGPCCDELPFPECFILPEGRHGIATSCPHNKEKKHE